MLYNPLWGKSKSQHAPETIPHLIEWLKGKDPNQTYDYFDNNDCLLSQYYKSLGYKDVFTGKHWMYHTRWRYWTVERPLPRDFNYVAEYGEWTFSEAIKRAEKCLTVYI